MRYRYVRRLFVTNPYRQTPTVYRGAVPHARRRARARTVTPGIIPTVTSVAIVSLQAGGEPTTRTLHKISVRARKASGTGSVVLKAALYEGGVNRSGDLTSSALTTSFALYNLTIGDTEAATITSYSNLEIRFWGVSSTGDIVDIDVAEIWLETPASVGAAVYSDSGTVILNLVPSGTESRVSTDVGTVPVLFTPSAVETRVSTDADTVPILLTASGTEAQVSTDIGTAEIRFTPSSVDTAQFVDTNTVPVLFTVSGTESRVTVDADTVPVLLTPSAAERQEPIDTGTVPVLFTVSGTESRVSTDTGTVPLLYTVSGTDIQAVTDAATVTVLLTVSAAEARVSTDSNTVPLLLTPSSTDKAAVTDAAEVYLLLSVSGTDTYVPPTGIEYVDSGTVTVLLTPSTAEAQVITDADTVNFKLTPSGVDTAQYVDTGEVRVNLTVSGSETYVPSGGAVFTDSATVAVILTPSGTEARVSTDVDTVSLKLTPASTDRAAFTEPATVRLSLTPSGTEQILTLPLVPVYPHAVQGPTLSTNLYAWISWGRNDRTITSYKVYRNGSLLTTVNVTGDTWDKCAFKDTTVSAGNTYTYEVSAVNAQGESAKSQIASIFIRSDAQIGATVNVDSQTGPTDREKINQALSAAKVAGGGIVQFGNLTYTLGDLTTIGDILSSAPKNVVWRGHASGTEITTSDPGDPVNTSNTENMTRIQGTITAVSALLTQKINEGDRSAKFDDVSWAIVGRKVRFDQSAGNGIGSIATVAGVTMDPGTPRDNSRSYEIQEIVSVNLSTKEVVFKYPFSAEFVIDSGELSGRALPTINQYGDNVGCGIENITFRGHADQATDENLFLVQNLLLNMPEFFFAECSFHLAGKSFVLHSDTGYVNYVGCKGYEQGAAADSESSASAVYSLNLNHSPNTFIIDCDFGLGYNPIQATLLTSGASEANLTSYSTASITPSANKLILLTILRNDDTLGTSPTITGNGLTWVLEESVAYDTAGGIRADLRVYRAMGASPTTGVITIDFGADGQQGCQWSVSEFDGVDLSGTNGSGAIVQSVPTSGTATGLTATLAAFARRSHATFGAFAHQFQETTTPGSLSWTELSDTNYLNPAENLQTQFRKDNSTAVSATWTTSSVAGAIGIELRSGTIKLNRRSHVTMNEGAHRSMVRHSRFYDTHTYNVNTHGLGVSDWLVENCYFEPTPFTQRGAVFTGNSSWGFDHQGIVRNNKCVSGPRLISSQENTYGVRVIANRTSGLAANDLVDTACVVEAYGWDGPDTPSNLTGSLRWTIRENIDVGLSGSHVRLEQIESSTYPTDGAGGGPSSGSWVRDIVHDSNSWNNSTNIVTPTNTERVPYDTSTGYPSWSSEVFAWQTVADVITFPDSATVGLKLTPSGTEFRVSTDSATIPIALSPSSTDTAQYREAVAVLLSLIPSGTEEHITPSFTDFGVVYLKLTPSVYEVLFLFDTCLSATATQRWAGTSIQRWTGLDMSLTRIIGTAMSKWGGSTSTKWSGTTLIRWTGGPNQKWTGSASKCG